MKLPTPQEVAIEIQNATFNTDQAEAIAAEAYQPLKEKLDAVEKALVRLTACLALELGASVVRDILKSLDN